MQNFQPLTDAEMEAVRKVQDIFRFMHRIACTACRCCTDGCPQHLPIRELLEQVAAEFEKKEEPKSTIVDRNKFTNQNNQNNKKGAK